MTKECPLLAADPPSKYRGLCLKCYKQAKSLVATGKCSWEKLEEMGLVAPANSSPFMKAFNEGKKDANADQTSRRVEDAAKQGFNELYSSQEDDLIDPRD